MIATVLFALPLLGSTAVEAQQTVSSRFRVLIPDFRPMNGENKGFGEKLADKLRDQISELNTHTAVSEKDIKNALKRFDLKMENLTCVQARQLAAQTNYEVVLCAVYAGTKERWEIQDIKFVDSNTGEEFLVDPITSVDKMEEQAASQIVDLFKLFVEQTRVAVFCVDYAQSQQWDSSLENCDRALELNPNANSVRYARANVLRQTERFEESLEEVQRLLEQDPFHENALLLGGFVAINLGDEELAREYYRQYLELDPTNATVRMRVAYDLAQEGDPLGAMEIIDEGIALDPENINYYEQVGNFAFAGAERVRAEAQLDGGEELTPEVADLYRKAIGAYERVFDAKGGETLVTQLRNVAAAHLQLGDAAASAEFSSRALELHAEEASLWDIYARALKEDGQVDEAVAALGTIEGIDPDWPNLHLRMGNWLIEVGRVEEAVPVLKGAVEKGSSADMAANMIFSFAHSNYAAPAQKNWGRFISMVALAKEFEVTKEAREQFDFWHAYALYYRGMDLGAAETVESANRTLPIFQQALRLFRESKGHADRTPSINYQTFVEAVGTYIEIQEAIIKRGR
jgi:tetratricopeptide (TPR) repeat protein